jgi:hypothetical protein
MNPILTVLGVLYLGALICAIASSATPPKVPLWVAVLLLAIAGLISVLPIGDSRHAAHAESRPASTRILTMPAHAPLVVPVARTAVRS